MEKAVRVGVNILKAVVFLSIAAAILYGANFVLKLKSIDGAYPAQMFYEQEPGTVDVVCIGSSHIYTDVNPAVLWTEYGIASYDLAGSNQPLWNTYYYMKEAIEVQSPELVIIDLYRILETRDVIDSARIAMNTSGLAYGENRADSVYASVEKEEEAMDYVLGFPIYHTRYESLEETDFLPYNGDVNGANYKGFNTNCIATTPFEWWEDTRWVEDKEPITQKNEEYLIKIMELAEETDTELLFIVAPYQGINYWEKVMYNTVEELADNYGVPFIDFNEHYEEMELDSMTDCAESSHLNYSGSEKFSRYLGQYIVENYQIDDHRGDERYASWDANAEHYEKIAYNFRLRNTEDVSEYLDMLLANEDYTVLISLDGDYASGGTDLAATLSDKGISASADAVVLMDRGEVVFYSDFCNKDGYDYHQDIGRETIVIQGLPTETTDAFTDETKENVTKSVTLSGLSCLTVTNGMNIMVYDNYTETFLDTFGFDASNGYMKVRY